MPKKNHTANSLEALIIETLDSQPVTGFRRAEIRRFLGHVDETYFRATFKKLVATGKIVRKRGGNYVLAEAASLKRGTIKVNQKGFAFVRFEDGSPDAFIPQDAIMGAMTDDTVLVKLDQELDVRGPSGTVVKILSRGHDAFVGCLEAREHGFVIRPLRRELPVAIPLVSPLGEDILQDAQEGDWVEARLVPGRRPNTPPSAELVRKMGRAGTVVKDLDAIVREYGLPKKYSAADSRKLVSEQPLLQPPREDLQDLLAVTIDPTDAKDFDDALSLAPGPRPGTAVLGVHIADVACFVPPQSPLSRQAGERGFTSYLPGRTIPMLPTRLSNELCCLRAGEPRNAHSVLMTVDMKTGKVLQSRRIHSTISVTRRLTCEEVTRFLQGEDIPELTKPLQELIANLGFLARSMRKRRRNLEAFLPIAVPEFQVLCGGRPIRVQSVARREESAASHLVEEFMLAANVQVALELQQKKIPALYRNHADPDLRGLDEFYALATALLGRKKVPSFAHRQNLVKFLAGLSGDISGELLAMAFLRCLPRACYGTACEGHFGLGKDVYCHFTSPIRRYPDLLVHQQLLAMDLRQPVKSMEFMEQQAQIINEQETNNDQAAFAALDRLKLRYLDGLRKTQPGECYQAYVMKATSDHLSLYLPEIGIMGIMENERNGSQHWFYDPRAASLVSRSGRRVATGNILCVQIKAIDPIHGELTLKAVNLNASYKQQP